MTFAFTPHEVATLLAAGGAFGVLCGLVLGYAWGTLVTRPRPRRVTYGRRRNWRGVWR